MSKLKFELLPGEEIIDTWTLLYIPPNGAKYNGKCTITNLRLVYDAKLDYTLQETLRTSLLMNKEEDGLLIIPKEKIVELNVLKSLMDKRVMLTLDNGQVHIFGYGIMNIDKVVDAINNNLQQSLDKSQSKINQ